MNAVTLAWQRATVDVRDRASRFRDAFNQHGDGLFLWRTVPTACCIIVAILLIVATRSFSLESALSLEKARASLDDARASGRHLQVERAMLRSPVRLREVAAGMRLTAPEAVVHLGPSARDRIVDAEDGTSP